MKVLLALVALLSLLPLNLVIAQQSQPSSENQASIDRLMRDAVAGEEISGEDIEALLHWVIPR